MFEVAQRQIAPQMVEDFAEIQTFRRQPPGKSPLAEAEPVGDRLCPRLGVRQERSDGVLHHDTKRADIGPTRGDGFLAVLDHQFVQQRVVPHEGKLRH